MARIKLGPLVTDISGSIGGMTIQRNRFGMSMRAKPLPLYSETPSQYNVRAKIKSLQHSWQALSDAERLQWNRFPDYSGATIRRDNSILISGQALYLKYQLFRLLCSMSLLTEISYIPLPILYTPVKIAVVGGTDWYLNFSGTVVVSLYYFVCKLTIPRNENQVFNARGLRFMPFGFTGLINYPLDPPYIDAFGALPPVDSFIHYSIQYFGVDSPMVTGVYTGRLEVVAV